MPTLHSFHQSTAAALLSLSLFSSGVFADCGRIENLLEHSAQWVMSIFMEQDINQKEGGPPVPFKGTKDYKVTVKQNNTDQWQATGNVSHSTGELMDVLFPDTFKAPLILDENQHTLTLRGGIIDNGHNQSSQHHYSDVVLPLNDKCTFSYTEETDDAFGHIKVVINMSPAP